MVPRTRADAVESIPRRRFTVTELREVWLVDVRAQTVDVHRRPALRGYREQHTYGRGETIVPLAFPRLRIRVNDLLG